MKCLEENHNWYYHTDDIRCCTKCGFIAAKTPRHFSFDEAKQIRRAAGFDEESSKIIQNQEPNPPIQETSLKTSFIALFVISVFVYVYLFKKFFGIFYSVDRLFIAVSVWLIILPIYKILKSRGSSLHEYCTTLNVKNNLNFIYIFIGILFTIGGLMGIKFGSSGIYKFGSFIFGGLILGITGFNLIGLFAPRRYIRFWIFYMYSSERLIVPDWAIVALPVLSFLSAIFTTEIPRVEEIINSSYDFWIRLMDISLILAFLTQFLILFNIFRMTKRNI